VKEAHKRNRNPKYKRKYRVTNWPEYDRSLKNRGDITLWFSEDAIQAWVPSTAASREARQVEAAIACKILNELLEQGRPDSVHVA